MKNSAFFLVLLSILNFWFGMAFAENVQKKNEAAPDASKPLPSENKQANEEIDKFFEHSKYGDFARYPVTKAFEVPNTN